MTESDTQRGILDAHENPIPRKPTWRERWKAVSRRTRIRIVAIVVAVPVVVTTLAGIVDILDKLQGHSSKEDAVARSDDLSDSSVLAATTAELHADFGYAGRVDDSWEGPLETLAEVSAAEFLEALKRGHAIVHLSVGFDAREVWFTDEVISTERFKNMFVAADGNTRLLVLDGCGSYAIGEVLKDSGIEYLVVALPRAAATQVFFRSFYLHLGKGVDPKRSFDLAMAEAKARNEDASGDYFFTSYK